MDDWHMSHAAPLSALIIVAAALVALAGFCWLAWRVF